MAYHGKKIRFDGEKCNSLIFEDLSLSLFMKKWRSGPICHDPKKFEIKHQDITTNRGQTFGTTLRV